MPMGNATITRGEVSNVRIWDGELTVGLKHFKSYEYLPQECQQVQQICDGVPPSVGDRINRVYSSGLEESVQKVFGVVGEAESGLFDSVGGEIAGCAGAWPGSPPVSTIATDIPAAFIQIKGELDQSRANTLTLIIWINGNHVDFPHTTV